MTGAKSVAVINLKTSTAAIAADQSLTSEGWRTATGRSLPFTAAPIAVAALE